MGRKVTDRGSVLREAIELILNEAPNPLTSQEIASNPLVKDLGYTPQQVMAWLSAAYNRGRASFPLRRVPVAGRGNTKFAWYNPEKHPQLEDRPRKPEAPPPAQPQAQPTVAHPFEFNPLPEEMTPPAPPPAASTLVVPQHVKSITLEVGGVRITLELDRIAGDR